MKLWIVNVDTKTKVLLKFGSLETVCGQEIKKATQIITLPIHVKTGLVHTLAHVNYPYFVAYETLECECRH